MTTPTTGKSAQTIPTIEAALRAILAEVTPGQRPFSIDSWLPDHLVELARTALATSADAVSIELHQNAHNALASAAWHVARGEPIQALSRIKRAQAHLSHSMEERAV